MNEAIKSKILDSIKGNKRGMLISEISRSTGFNKITVKKYLLTLSHKGLVKATDITETRKLWYENKAVQL